MCYCSNCWDYGSHWAVFPILWDFITSFLYLAKCFKFVSFFISLIAFLSLMIKLFRIFLFMSFDSILLTPCRNLSAFSKVPSRSSVQISLVSWMSTLLETNVLFPVYVGTNFGSMIKNKVFFSSSYFLIWDITACFITLFAGVVLMLLPVAFLNF